MSFIADKQTLDDLNIPGKYKPGSVFSLFNRTRTTGGERLLERMFREPLADHGPINHRSAIFHFFQQKKLNFPFSKQLVQEAENYLAATAPGHFLVTMVTLLRRKFLSVLVHDEQFTKMRNGLDAAVELLKAFNTFIGQFNDHVAHAWQDQQRTCKKLLAHPGLQQLRKEGEVQHWSWLKLARYDHFLRVVFRNEMVQLMEIIYHLDVNIAVSEVADAKGFCYAQALPPAEQVLTINGLRHPALNNAVTNRVAFDQHHNLCFLTGANMAGKSTFMKSFGIAVYLAHMGFPVPAGEMFFSVKDGIYSSINVADDLAQGYSHFYAEVLRVKKVAEDVSRLKNLVVLFDELFKGTNVKDAYDASLGVTIAFSRYTNCTFIISTHIIEAGMALQQQCANIQFAYLPTVMNGVVPRYTYRLEEGISNDRHGMRIIENEGILELILSRFSI